MGIKKLLPVMLLAVAGTAFAQSTESNERVVFNPHWYIQLQGGASHTLGEAKFSKLISPAVAGNIGYKFNPIFDLRAGVSAWQAKGGWVNPRTTYKFNYLQGNVDAVFNLSNLICGFNPTRVFSGYGFAGVGLNHAYKNDEANDLAKQGYELKYLWDGSKNLFVGRAGLGADIRLNDYLAFNLEVNANMLSDKYNSKKAGNPDWQFNALAGFSINLGKGYTKNEAPASYENYAQETPAPVKEEVKPAAPVEQKAEEKKEVIKEDIFFTIGSTKVSDEGQQKINNLLSYLNKYPESKIILTGYADKGTGTANVNKKISEKRALMVSKLLESKGVSSDRITTEYKGDTVQPFDENDENRVTICVAE